MADDERPAKMQKRQHSPQTEDAAFAETTQPAAANGSADNTTTTAAQPDAAQNVASNDNTDAMSVDDNNDNAGDNGEASTATAVTTTTDQPAKPGPPPGMTKSAWKKQKRQAEWEAGRDARKAQRKEKNKARKERKRQAYHAGNEGGGGGIDVAALDHPHRHQRELQDQLRSQKAVQLPITFVFDCSFDELMMDKEMKSLGQQITRCYSDNRNAAYRAHLCISSFGGNLKERFDGLLNGHYKSWKGFRAFEEDFVEVAEKAKGWMGDLREGGRLAGTLAEIADREKKGEKAAEERDDRRGEVVYLSSEGTETLHELKPYSTYIIGGLVDKNRYKGICHKRATERGIKTAKLPIGEFLQMNSRSVLATNHVNEIMLQWLACGDWGEAFMKVIPKRKGGQLKSTGEEDDEDNDHDNADVETAEKAEASNDTHAESGSSADAAEATEAKAE
ncbi:trna m g methyltransferase domain containing protein [Diplodia corticola]|uniref:tRNA (guanine(9)-N1)-methyltransferase n=1 Tax=Diplodia corticola TaxID=236234 RepID=A0A1J9SDR8_9PEZI|nr:trna m g methyltransferase domain containing protein [Diplodia corticola]OJD37980.1 trna m g methyltransferase domain containing protein [Diplodia corticola]